MPAIDIQVLEGVFSDEEKAEIIRKVTDAFGDVAGKTIRAGTSVRIHEVKSGSWGYAGNVLTTADAKAMRDRG
ncbi:tautomerase family protein [Pseudoruegeria sp. HB172150]|uniref:tautomerase family protein n=1 Tax=Pseudoruegeria sp. HB172150 TaxID=2721164 RepID=UPI001552678E|nr:tautomerase family protein [Pseudoruegeria sp. HB172150]